MAKLDVTLSFATYLKSLPKDIEVCRPVVLDMDMSLDSKEALFLPGFMMQDLHNPLLI